ncbi:hypothetical protein GW17_00043915 [Ensete ventricosum]|nr:hypothetical protein GW17_00043915 [Ensete ventricosum]
MTRPPVVATDFGQGPLRGVATCRGSRPQGQLPAARCPQGRRPTKRRSPAAAATCGHSTRGRACGLGGRVRQPLAARSTVACVVAAAVAT